MADAEKSTWDAVTAALAERDYVAALDAAAEICRTIAQCSGDSREALQQAVSICELDQLRPSLASEKYMDVGRDGVSAFFNGDPRLQLMRALRKISKHDTCGDGAAMEVIDTHARSLFYE